MMKRGLLAAAGALITLVGIVWTLQGLGFIGGSFMSGNNTWAIIGPIVIIVGMIMVAAGLRGGRALRRRL